MASVLTVILTFWFVLFTDKGGSDKVALGAEALALRAQRGIAIDSLDYAVCEVYVDSLRKKGARVCHTTRWLNGATIEASMETATAINALPFVKSVEATRFADGGAIDSPKKNLLEQRLTESTNDFQTQLELFNLPRLHEEGYRGQGVTIAAIDCGFRNLNTLTVFDSIRDSGRLLGTYDFADDEIPFFGEGSEHGSMCLALIAGDREDYQGAANQAKFYALRSEEVEMETPKEPDNWIAAVEKCDSLGVWIVSTSLGYSVFDYPEWNYTYEHLDGKTYRASRAAAIAARKGLLLCMAAGNSAETAWPWINVPSDADSILTVGAVSSDSVVTLFSSYGPTADGRIKPDVCAMGLGNSVINPATDQIASSKGTSFATPLVAGLAACLWSAYPTETNMQIRERIIRSAHLYSTPSKFYGYGIPDAWKAYSNKPGGIYRLGSVSAATRKILRDGQVIIERNGEQYNLTGQKLKIDIQ